MKSPIKNKRKVLNFTLLIRNSAMPAMKASLYNTRTKQEKLLSKLMILYAVSSIIAT